MKKSGLPYIIIVVAVVLILQNVLIMKSVHEMSGDARIVNYSGLVRGGTQRLVKLELSHRPNDALMEKVGNYLDGLSGMENDYQIAYMDDPTFQNSIGELMEIWADLKEAIYAYRNDAISAEEVLELSESHFAKADEATADAEQVAGAKLQKAELFIIASILCITFIIVTVVVLIVILRRTELRRLEELEAAKTHAEKANAAKSTFLSNMSHDIRTPLNGIVGMTAIASQNTKNPEKIADCLKQITNSSHYLLSLINGVLDMSKIESGQLKLNPSAFSLTAFMENLISVIQQQVSSKKQDFSVITRNVVHENLVCDVLRLSQVFINILSNSVKFTPVGGKLGITLIEMPSDKEGYAHFQFICFDNGMGMSKEFLDNIFQAFTREEDTRIDKIEGTGLGMSISKGIVDMLNGEIKVESEKGKGTKFTIDLDIEIGEPVMLWDSDTLRDLKVLIVDDDVTICESAVGEMQELGIQATGLTYPQDAIHELESAHPPYDLMIVDWKMPGINGLELIKLVRAQVSKTMPILLSSAYDWVEIEPKTKDLGINGFIDKPLFRSSLFTKIRSLFKSEDGSDHLETHAKPEYDFSGVKVLIAEDNELNMRIMIEILSSLGIRLDGVIDGQEAVKAFSRSAEYHYDVILMDIQMPVLNGYEATKAIRKLDRKDAKTIPIIAMTANAFEEDIKDALAVGMNDHVAKPLDFDIFKAVLNKHLRNASHTKQPVQETAESTPKKPEHNASDLLAALKDYGIDVSSGLARFVNNRTLYEGVIYDFPQDQSYADLVEAMEARDFKKAEIAAHTLKGLSANLSFNKLADALQQILVSLRSNNYEEAYVHFAGAKSQYEALITIIRYWAAKLTDSQQSLDS